MRLGIIFVASGLVMWMALLGALSHDGGAGAGPVTQRESTSPAGEPAAVTDGATREPDGAVAGAQVEPTPTATATASPAPEGRVYIVVAGDTMVRIAQRHNVTLRALLDVNPQIADPTRIEIGDRINLPE